MNNTKVAVVLLIALLLASPLRADSVSITGTIDKPGDWTVDRVRTELAADVATISYTGHDGKKHTSMAVPLLSLLKASGLQTQLKSSPNADPKTKHFELRLAVAVQGHDGYVAAFSLSELQPDLGNRHVWLAFDTDGQPLAASDGPMKLVASDDAKPARWVHAVQTISVVNVAPPTTKPSN